MNQEGNTFLNSNESKINVIIEKRNDEIYEKFGLREDEAEVVFQNVTSVQRRLNLNYSSASEKLDEYKGIINKYNAELLVLKK